jgi:hypothetical protein
MEGIGSEKVNEQKAKRGKSRRRTERARNCNCLIVERVAFCLSSSVSVVRTTTVKVHIRIAI